MKKIFKALSLVILLMLVAISNVEAAKTVINNGQNTAYGTISKDEVVSDGISTSKIYVTKSIGQYIYLTISPGYNIKEISVVEAASGFTLVSTVNNTDGGKTVLVKKDNGSVTADTHILNVVALQENTGSDCNITISPIPLACKIADGKYFIENGKEVTKEEYEEVCGNLTEDEKNPQMGIAIPYFAVGGGLLAIAGVYFYSRKSKKMYKI